MEGTKRNAGRPEVYSEGSNGGTESRIESVWACPNFEAEKAVEDSKSKKKKKKRQSQSSLVAHVTDADAARRCHCHYHYHYHSYNGRELN